MNYTTYGKLIPPFFQDLLKQISKINIFSFDAAFPVPSKTIHYRPYKSGIAIYTSPIIKLSHELSHMIETRDNRRLLQFDYGMRKYFPTTHKGQLQAVAREARTRGIQTRMVECAFGNATLLIHRAADLLIKPFDKPVAKFNTSKELLDWSAAITQKTYNDWSKERIIEEWNKKAEFINHWLETSGLNQLDDLEQMRRYKLNEQWFSSSRH